MRPTSLWTDRLVAALVALFAMATVRFPPPNHDLWWLLAVGRRIVETGAYIYQDPFTFTVAGTPWSPQSYATGILFYLLHAAGGMDALTAVRMLAVGGIVLLTFRSLRYGGVSWTIASPLVLVAVLVSQGRFSDRGQLFEYVFVAWLVGFLLTSHARAGRSFFVVPVLIQLAWVQLHSSFLLGPLLAAAFVASEWIATRVPVLRPLERRDFRRAWMLVAMLAAVCAVNPNPRAFLVQPFDPVQRDLMSRFTLEWKGPFDPAVAAGNFHPWYEAMLALAAIAILVRLARLPFTPAVLLVLTAAMSFQSHRFRVEFALVAAPMIALLLRGSAPVAALSRVRVPRVFWNAAAIVLTLGLMLAEHERVGARSPQDSYPDAAISFVRENDIAHRPFHTIGTGSYLLWAMYGERATFIDGRNFATDLYADFLRAQTGAGGLRTVSEKYRLDSFLLPAPALADAGMTSVHRGLLAARERFSLVYMDERAFVYVAAASVDSVWLAAHAYHAYHPLSFTSERHSAATFERALVELERAVAEAPEYSQVWMDLGLLRHTRGEFAAACAAFEEATRIDPGNAVAWNQLGHAALQGGDAARAAAAYRELVTLAPDQPAAYASLVRALEAAGDVAAAIAVCDRWIERRPQDAAARELRAALTRSPGE